MTTTIKVSEKVLQDESLFERLDGTKGLRDFAREHIVNPSVAYAGSKANRLAGALEFLRKYAKHFADADELIKYAKHVASGTAADIGHLRPMWDYWARAPKACAGFLDGLVDESALRYACANKQHVQIGKGDDKLRVQLTLDSVMVSRYEYIESMMPGKLRDVKKRMQEGDGGKLDRTELADSVESVAVKLSSAEGVTSESAQWRAEETAQRAVKSIISDSATKRLPNTELAYGEYVKLMHKLADNAPETFDGGVTVINSKQLERTKGRAQAYAHDADLWTTLESIADAGGIPRNADDAMVENVMRVVAKVAKLVGPYFTGDLTPGVVSNDKQTALPVAMELVTA